jgi:hypothetical protein
MILSWLWLERIFELHRNLFFFLNLVCPRVELSKTTGTINSYNYPGKFPGNIDCLWVLEAPHEESVINFEFRDFNLGTCDPSLTCIECGSKVQAHEISQSSKILTYETWCRDEAPKLTFFHGSRLNLKFQTSSRNQGKGFVAKYRYVRKNLGN